jgi:hypothetical protein
MAAREPTRQFTIILSFGPPKNRSRSAKRAAYRSTASAASPVTLYKEQWTKLLDMADDTRAFIRANDSCPKTKS